MYVTFCEIADNVSATIETIGHNLCPPPQRLKDRLAATSFESMLVSSGSTPNSDAASARRHKIVESATGQSNTTSIGSGIRNGRHRVGLGRHTSIRTRHESRGQLLGPRYWEDHGSSRLGTAELISYVLGFGSWLLARTLDWGLGILFFFF